MKFGLGVIAAGLLLSSALYGTAWAQQPADANAPVDRSSRSADDRVTDQIRKALAADQSVSASVKNVEIATNQQAVVLRGAVASIEDKERIETVAGQYAGTRQVESELTIRDSQDAAQHHIAAPPARK